MSIVKNQISISEEIDRIRKIKFDYGKVLANIPPIYMDAKLSDFHPIPDKIVLPDDSCFIHGNVGTGKTYLACALANALIWGRTVRNEKYRVRFIRVYDLITRIQNTFQNENSFERSLDIIKFYSEEVDYLFLDDLGVEKVTEWVIQTIDSLIDYRYNHGKHLVITSNYSLLDIERRFDERIASRIAASCDLIFMKGPDKRLRKKGK